MSQQHCSVAKKENLLLECTNLHMVLSKNAKHTDLEDGLLVWASTLEGASINPSIMERMLKQCPGLACTYLCIQRTFKCTL